MHLNYFSSSFFLFFNIMFFIFTVLLHSFFLSFSSIIISLNICFKFFLNIIRKCVSFSFCFSWFYFTFYLNFTRGIILFCWWIKKGFNFPLSWLLISLHLCWFFVFLCFETIFIICFFLLNLIFGFSFHFHKNLNTLR